MARAEPRVRILRAFEYLSQRGSDVPIDKVAKRAGVSVQTIYSHFGSKRGLLFAAIDQMQSRTGLYAGLDEVFNSPDGVTALSQMLRLTFNLWATGWPLVRFTLAARRTDPEVDAQLAEVDAMRHSHLWTIYRRIHEEGRLLPPLSPERAADWAFALSTPGVFEELVHRRGWPVELAAEEQRALILRATVNSDLPPVLDPPPNWTMSGTRLMTTRD